jgi:hypothetical protein
MQSNLNNRLQRLETATPQAASPLVDLVIYDPKTGQAITPVEPKAPVQVWLPENGRDREAAKQAET